MKTKRITSPMPTWMAIMIEIEDIKLDLNEKSLKKHEINSLLDRLIVLEKTLDELEAKLGLSEPLENVFN